MDAFIKKRKLLHTTHTRLMELPMELMDDIFSRLPAKTLCRLKCVCKAWLHSLTNLSLAQLHYARSIKNQPLLIACDYSDTDIPYEIEHLYTFYTFNLDPQLLHEFDAIIFEGITDILNHPSCFTLLCVQTTSTFVICNPSTLEVVTLPHPSRTGTNRGCDGGFGCYPASSDHYQHRHVVVHVLTDEAENITGCEELTFGIGDDLSKCSWRMLNAPPPPAPTQLSGYIGGGAFVDGVFYWLTNKPVQILGLDLKEERFATIALPPDPDFDDDNFNSEYVRIAELKENLYSMRPFFMRPFGIFKVKMWKLTMDKTNEKVAEWSKEYSIRLPRGFDYFYPRHILNHGAILADTESWDGEAIHSYDKQTKTLNKLVNLNTIVTNSEDASYWGVRLHIDNIFSLKPKLNSS